uniref:tyrosinase-like isoform X1 n=2 Tax=Ciona intestinalis TaxID=7719 RepID=UPI000EF51B86|nr:tyrosinase-like isoform X1 [Ciona intestinalis]|eukprot:XP_026693053.1 tyrosinase-like isoform X1 [Ciona intestinalis]
MYLTVFTVYLFISVAYAQFPRRCTDSESLRARECCPTFTDDSKCGESSNRGICSPINTAPLDLTRNETIQLLLDDRAFWPRAFYDRACRCYGNFDGLDCSSCKAGYQGDNCDVRSALRIRRNFTSMDKTDIQKFVTILDESKRVTSKNYVILVTSYDRILAGEAPEFLNISVYNLFVWMHAYVSRDNLVFQDDVINSRLFPDADITQENRAELVRELLNENVNLDVTADVDYAHEGPAFLPWHRYYLLKWEQELRDVVANDVTFTIPYWDWRDNQDCDVCNDVMMGGNDADNVTLISQGSPISKWEIICSKGNDYIEGGSQCTGASEGPLLRSPGNYDPTKISGLPTSQEVDDVIVMSTAYDTDDYDVAANQSFRNLVEGFANTTTGVADPSKSYLHNAVHLFMNGTMSEVATSANDPIFVLHHAYVDSLYELWLRRRGIQGRFDVTEGVQLGHRADDFMVPFFPLVRNRAGFATSTRLGYVYDYMVDDVINDVASGDGLADDVTDPPTGEFSARTKFLFRASSAGVGSKLAASRFAGSRNSQRNFRSRPLGEGGFTLEGNLPNVVLTAGESQMLVAENKAAAVDVITLPTTATMWEKVKSWFVNLARAIRNMTSRQVTWFVIVCLLIMAAMWAFACLCRSRRSRKRHCCSSMTCRCCYDYGMQDGEEVALLETKSDVIVKGKVMKAKTYM